MAGLLKGNWSSPYWTGAKGNHSQSKVVYGKGIQRAGCYSAWLHIICHIHTHTQREKCICYIHAGQVQQCMRKVCKSSAICMQSGIRRAASSKTAAGLPPIEAAVVREGDGGRGEGANSLAMPAPTFLSVYVCTYALHCGQLCAVTWQMFFQFAPKEGRVGLSRLGYYE